MEKGTPGNLYHLSPEQGISIRDLVSRICKLMSMDYYSSVTVVGERQGQDRAYTLDSAKARSELNWIPQITLDECLQRVIAWVTDNWDIIRAMSPEYIHQE